MEIGSIIMPPPPGNRFTLAGRTWEVLDVEPKAKIIWVRRVEGIANVSWRGGSSNIHTKVLERMRAVLSEDVQYSYLQVGAKERLKTARQLLQEAGLDKGNILPLEDNTCCIFPWMGTVAYRTLERLLNFCRRDIDIRSISGQCPYFMTVKIGSGNLRDLHDEILFLCRQKITAYNLISIEEAPKLQKYDKFTPPDLRRKAFACDYLDVEELGKIVSSW